MDREHQQLIAAMQTIEELDRKRATKAAVDAALQRLVGLTKQHFTDEEAHMRSIGYPDLETHALIHADMLEKIGAHYRTFLQGDGRVPPAFLSFLTFWLGSHIQGIDRKYANHGAPVAGKK